MGENCSTGCPTRDHASFGECMRAKNTRVAWAKSAQNLDATREKQHQRRLTEYRAARQQGIQPASTSLNDVRRAVKASNDTGVAFRADRPGGV